MDDDLRVLGALLTKPEPREEVIDRGRHRLRTAMRGPARRGWFAWPMASVTAVATAATAAVVVSSVMAPDATPNSPPVTVGPAPSGRQVLLAAAAAAETRPAGSGAYWHVKMVNTDWRGTRSTETWTRRDGREYSRNGSGPVALVRGWPSAFTVAATLLSFEQIQRLPADPAALEAKLIRMVGTSHSPPRDHAGPERTMFLFDSLTILLTEMPAPPKVRAAAFRAIASLPEVTRVGSTAGAQTLLIRHGAGDLDMRMVIDPATSQVRGWITVPIPGRPAAARAMTWTVSIPTAEWTNEPPPK